MVQTRAQKRAIAKSNRRRLKTSKCRGKRPAVCRGTAKCTLASGKKRSFCRTRKNRRRRRDTHTRKNQKGGNNDIYGNYRSSHFWYFTKSKGKKEKLDYILSKYEHANKEAEDILRELSLDNNKYETGLYYRHPKALRDKQIHLQKSFDELEEIMKKRLRDVYNNVLKINMLDYIANRKQYIKKLEDNNFRLDLGKGERGELPIWSDYFGDGPVKGQEGAWVVKSTHKKSPEFTYAKDNHWKNWYNTLDNEGKTRIKKFINDFGIITRDEGNLFRTLNIYSVDVKVNNLQKAIKSINNGPSFFRSLIKSKHTPTTTTTNIDQHHNGDEL